MKSAKETAELAASKNKTSQLPAIEKSILAAANKGEYSCWIYSSISDEVRIKLTELGFEVGQPTFERNENLTKISWK